jgi:DNA-3-methyladenine glycosylase
MPEINRLEREFFTHPTEEVARRLLGMRLVRVEAGQRLAGLIVETECYRGETDLACHARAGITSRTKVMYGEPGHAYVYLNYGLHWLLNIVTEEAGFPAAVLLRALFPTEGIAVIARRRSGQPRLRWADGPGKLTQALGIDSRFNGADLCSPEAVLFIEMGLPVPDSSVTIGPRVGLNSVPEPWKSIPWRFRVERQAIFSSLCLNHRTTGRNKL